MIKNAYKIKLGLFNSMVKRGFEDIEENIITRTQLKALQVCKQKYGNNIKVLSVYKRGLDRIKTIWYNISTR